MAALVGGLALAAACASPTSPVSAFWGLDDALPAVTAALCPEAPGLDGMPIVLGSEVDNATLDPTDFEVLRASGRTSPVACATLLPSIDLGELRTVLLIGQFGSLDDPPVLVTVVDELRTIDGQGDFQGSSVGVTPLADGPSLVLAAELTDAERRFSATQEPPTSCLADPTNRVLRVTWDGGITLPGGGEPTDADVDIYQIAGTTADGSLTSVTPIGFADLDDNDNVHELCFDGSVTPIAVTAAPDRLDDPRGDLNGITTVLVAQM